MPMTPVSASFSAVLAAMLLICVSSEVVEVPLALYKQKYYLPILVGTPGQTAQVVLDTGSSYLYIPQEECYYSDGQKCKPPRLAVPHLLIRFNPDASSTFEDLHKQYKSSYSGGYSASLRAFRDMLEVGDVKAKATMGLNTEYSRADGAAPSSDRYAIPYSGLWGLAPHSAAITELLASNQLTPIISLYFKPDPNTAALSAVAPSGAGYLTIGGWDPKFAAEELQWISLRSDDSKSWTVVMSGVQLGDQKLSMCDDTCPFLTDSGGASLLSMPDEHRAAIYRALGANSNGVVPCDNVASFPDLTFVLDGSVTISLPATDYIAQNGDTCILKIFGGTEKFWIGGYAFMRYYYHVFDFGAGGNGTPRIGIAKAVASA